MKSSKLIITLLLITFIFQVKTGFSQCPNDNTAWVDLTPATCPGTANSSCVFGGEYVTVNVTNGNTYTIQTCGDTDFDTQVTIYNNTSGAYIAYNDDGCGTQSTINWTANFTGSIRVLVDKYNCVDQATCMTLTVSCSPPATSYNHPTAGLQGTYLGACMVNTCNATYYDNGGASSNYSNDINNIYRTFCPSQPGNCIKATFNSFSTESGYDILSVLNGPTQNSTAIGNYSGSTLPPAATSTDPSGCLGFRFYSDWMSTAAGWNVSLTCVPCAGGPSATEDNNCSSVNSVCGNSPITGAATGPGLTSECSGCVISENYSNWYKIYIGATGNLSLTLNPVNNNDDYDFAIWGPNPNCATLGSTSPVRCSYAANIGNTGLNSTGAANEYSEDVNGDGWVRVLPVTAGQTYYLMVNGWTSAAGGFNIEWTGSTASLGTPPGSVTVQANNTCTGLNNGTACAVVNAGMPPFSYSWNTGSSTSCLSNLSPGTYYVTVTDGSGCTSSASQVVTNFGSPSASFTSTPVSCSGNADGSITVTPSGGSGPYSINWSNSQSTQTISGLTASTYYVTVTDANTCTTSSSYTLVAPPVLNPGTIGTNQEICNGSTPSGLTSIAAASGGTGTITYQWQQTTVAGCASGWTDIPGATSATYAPPSLTQTTCFRRSATNNCPTAYSNTVTITVNPNPTATFYATNTCSGTTTGSICVVVSSGTGPYNYSWNNGGSSSCISGLGTGTFSVTVTDSKTCQFIGSQTITSLENPSASLSQTDVNCNGANNGTITVTPSGGTSFTYLWSNSLTTATINNLSPGTYTVTVTNQNGCKTNVSATINSPAPLTGGTIDASQTICEGSTPNALTSTAPASGGAGAISYQWQKTTDAGCNTGWVDIPGANGQTYSPPALTQTTCYRRKALDNCIAVYTIYSNTVTITVNPLPVIVSTNKLDVSICGGSNGAITINATGATGYSITGGAPFFANGGVFTGLTAGSYTVQVQSANNCVANGPTLVINAATAPAAPVAGANASYCAGVTASNLTATPGAGGTISWYTDPGLSTSISNSSSLNPNPYLSTGTNSFYVTETTGICESGPTQINIIVYPIPTATATPVQQAICSGQSTSIDIVYNPANSTPAWSFTQSATVSGASVPIGNSIYQVLSSSDISADTVIYTVIPSANNCTGSPLNIPVLIRPHALVLPHPNTETICSGGTTNINLTSSVNNVTYYWTATNVNTTGATSGSGNSIQQIITTNSNIGTATYYVVPTANGCPGSTASIIITVNPIPNAIVSNNNDSICSGTAANISISSVVSNTSFSWTVQQTGASGASDGNGSQINQVLTSVFPAIGEVEYSIVPFANTCYGDTVVESVWVVPLPVTTVTPASQVICTGQTAVIDLSSAPGTQFSWSVTPPPLVSGPVNGSGNQISQVITSTSTVQENINYSISSNYLGCTGQNVSATVSVNPSPDVSITIASDTICSNDTTNINMTSLVSGTTFSWTVTGDSQITGESDGTGNSISQALSNSDTIMHTVTYNITAFANTCQGETETVTVFVNPSPVIDSVNTADASFCGGNDGYINIFAHGNLQLIYSVTGSTGLYYDNAGMFDSISSGNYPISVKNLIGCYTNWPAVSISAAGAPPVPDLFVDTIAHNSGDTLKYCFGEQTDSITAVPHTVGGKIVWYSNPSLTMVIDTAFSILPSSAQGVLTYYVREVNGACIGAASNIVVQVRALPTFVVDPSVINICSGDSALINLYPAQQGTAFSWTVDLLNQISGDADGAGNSIRQLLVNSSALSDSVIYTITPVFPAVNGCIGQTKNVVVHVHPIPNVSLDLGANSEVCRSNNGLALTGGIPVGGNYSGIGVTSGNTFTPSTPGSYEITYTYTDNHSCVGIATDSIKVNSLPVVTLNAFNPVCINSVNILSGGSGAPAGGAGVYSGVSVSGGTFIPVATGIHSITYTYTDLNGCIASASRDIDVKPLPSFSLVVFHPISCNGATGSLQVTPPGFANYNWSNDTTNHTQIADNLSANVNYSVTVTSQFGCKSMKDTMLVEPSVVVHSLTYKNPTCNMTNGEISDTVSGGTPPYVYNWSHSSVNTNQFVGLSVGTYYMTVSDANGCSILDTVVLTSTPSVSAVVVKNNVLCNGGSTGSVSLTNVTGTAPVHFIWSTADTTSSIDSLSAGTYDYYIIDNVGCSSSGSVVITQPNALSITLTGYNVPCFETGFGKIESSVSGGISPYTYYWSDFIHQVTPTAVGLIGTPTGVIYYLTVTDANGCKIYGQDTIYKPLAGLSVDSISSKNADCFGSTTGSAFIRAEGGTPSYTYLWGTSPVQSGNRAVGLSAGKYVVTITDSQNCHKLDSVIITQPTEIKLDTIVTTMVSCENGDDGVIRIHATGGSPDYTYSWLYNSSTSHIAINLKKGTHSVRVTDKMNCFSLFNIDLTSKPVVCLEIPTVFSPNDDNVHDKWVIKNLHLYPKAKIEVYNRWGSLIWSRENASQAFWDGKYMGNDTPGGSYLYIIDLGDGSELKKGTITILR